MKKVQVQKAVGGHPEKGGVGSWGGDNTEDIRPRMNPPGLRAQQVGGVDKASLGCCLTSPRERRTIEEEGTSAKKRKSVGEELRRPKTSGKSGQGQRPERERDSQSPKGFRRSD